ncbi:hypothetical protein D9M71_435700 [compost metagenome]
MLVQPMQRFIRLACLQQKLDGGCRLVLGEIPARGVALQFGDLLWLLALQRGTQVAGEQAVIAEPLAAVVEREEEQAVAFQAFEQCLAVAASGQRVAQRGAELVEDAGVQQELAAVLVQTGEDVFGQVVGQRQAGGGQRVAEDVCVVPPAQGQRRQVQGSRPAFAVALQVGDLLVVQVVLPAEEAPGFLGAET